MNADDILWKEGFKTRNNWLDVGRDLGSDLEPGIRPDNKFIHQEQYMRYDLTDTFWQWHTVRQRQIAWPVSCNPVTELCLFIRQLWSVDHSISWALSRIDVAYLQHTHIHTDTQRERARRSVGSAHLLLPRSLAYQPVSSLGYLPIICIPLDYIQYFSTALPTFIQFTGNFAD